MRPRDRGSAIVAIALAFWLLAGCASRHGTVVLLPERDGRETAVVVRQEGKELVLGQPYAAANLTSSGPRAYTSNATDVQASFGPALAAQPLRPARFTLYFIEGSDELTDDSKRNLELAISEIAARPVPDIVVIGHTDRVGSDPYNDALALQRADAVRSALVRQGIAPENIVVAGRGKREPAIPTADGVAEPRNRRVEVLVR